MDNNDYWRLASGSKENCSLATVSVEDEEILESYRHVMKAFLLQLEKELEETGLSETKANMMMRKMQQVKLVLSAIRHEEGKGSAHAGDEKFTDDEELRGKIQNTPLDLSLAMKETHYQPVSTSLDLGFKAPFSQARVNRENVSSGFFQLNPHSSTPCSSEDSASQQLDLSHMDNGLSSGCIESSGGLSALTKEVAFPEHISYSSTGCSSESASPSCSRLRAPQLNLFPLSSHSSTGCSSESAGPSCSRLRAPQLSLFPMSSHSSAGGSSTSMGSICTQVAASQLSLFTMHNHSAREGENELIAGLPPTQADVLELSLFPMRSSGASGEPTCTQAVPLERSAFPVQYQSSLAFSHGSTGPASQLSSTLHHSTAQCCASTGPSSTYAPTIASRLNLDTMGNNLSLGYPGASAGQRRSGTVATKLSLQRTKIHSSTGYRGASASALRTPVRRTLQLDSSIMHGRACTGKTHAPAATGPASSPVVPMELVQHSNDKINTISTGEFNDLPVFSSSSEQVQLPALLSAPAIRHIFFAMEEKPPEKTEAYNMTLDRNAHTKRRWWRMKRRNCYTIVVPAVSDNVGHIPEDEFTWQKYDQKPIKATGIPRCYYRCSVTGCLARKHIERCSKDPTQLFVTYAGEHKLSCFDPPVRRSPDTPPQFVE